MSGTATPSGGLGRVLQRVEQGLGQGASCNVGDTERLACLVGGGALAAYGLLRGSLSGLALAALGGVLAYRGASGYCALYNALGIDTSSAGRGPATSVPAGRGVRVDRTITINRSPDELFRFWRQLENLPRIMSHLESVQSRGSNTSHWVARGPLGVRLEWDAEIHNERPNEMIAWRSLAGSQVDTAGSVHFQQATGGRGTVVRVELKYDPPGGQVAASLAGLLGEDAGQAITEDLRRFKQMMEAGEVVTTSGQPSGRKAGS